MDIFGRAIVGYPAARTVTTIVVDTCAGQAGQALEAAAIASLELDVQVVVVGDESDITDQLNKIAHDAERLSVLHAPHVLPDGVSAQTVDEVAPRSSLAVGLAYTATQPDAVFISAGRPSILIHYATQSLQRIPSVGRLALAAVYPTLHHRGPNDDPFALLLDVGATAQCTGDHLVTFAAMGAAYASKISGVVRPRVALLSNGRSVSAAPLSVQDADLRLQRHELAFDYIGTIRGDQITVGEADVIVTNGFTGDVVVRTLEGVAATAEALLVKAQDRFQWRLGMSILGGGIDRLREFTNWENYGGAPLLGVQHPVIVTQSNSGLRAFLNAIRLGAKIVRLEVIGSIGAGVEALRNLERAFHQDQST